MLCTVYSSAGGDRDVLGWLCLHRHKAAAQITMTFIYGVRSSGEKSPMELMQCWPSGHNGDKFRCPWWWKIPDAMRKGVI